MGNKTKQTGKTEVYPFWYMEDIKNMMDYFKMKEMWHWYLAFNFQALGLNPPPLGGQALAVLQ